jgi:hypothetical protein
METWRHLRAILLLPFMMTGWVARPVSPVLLRAWVGGRHTAGRAAADTSGKWGWWRTTHRVRTVTEPCELLARSCTIDTGLASLVLLAKKSRLRSFPREIGGTNNLSDDLESVNVRLLHGAASLGVRR